MQPTFTCLVVSFCHSNYRQNAAERLVSGARRHDHITPVLVSQHWLPVCQRIIYKTAVLVWKCLHDAAYSADLAHSVHGHQQLRSKASGTLLVPRTRTTTGQCSFVVNGPRTWNSLPADPRTPDTSLCSFKRHLKAHLFQQLSTLLLESGLNTVRPAPL